MSSTFPSVNQCPLRYWTLHTPQHCAVLLNGQAISFRQMDDFVVCCQQKLHDLGLIQGQHLAVITDEAIGTVFLAMACLRLGVVFCPINPAFPESQVQAYCEKVQATKVIHSTEVLMDGRTFNAKLCDTKLCATNEGMINVTPETMMTLMATSGTSGVPKAVAHCYSNHYFNASGSQQTTPLTANDHWLLSLPLFHVGGFAIVMRCLQAGATIVVDSHKTPLNKLLQTSSVTHLSLVNTQLYRLLQQDFNLYDAGVRYILLGGGIASPVLVDKALKQRVKLMTTYGMTEMASQVCTGAPEFISTGVTSGEVLPDREVSIAEDGEILVRGKPLALGYFDNGQLQPVTDSQGWYHTSDKGRWHKKQLKVSGRIDNLFISGGENIHPEEIEQALLMLPEVVQAVVVVKNSEEFGQRPVAYVQIEEGKVDEAFTKKRLEGKIPRFKIPDRIRPFPHNMVNTGIKVNRRFFQQLNDS